MKNLIMQNKKMLTGLRKRSVDAIALTMILVVGVAAYGKWFYPVEILQGWERIVAVFELFFIGFIWIFRRRPSAWLISALMFASWGGYASFWYQLKLPCSCMGTKFPIPTLYAILLDALFIMTSMFLAKWLGASQKRLFVFGGLLLISGVLGFFVGHQIYARFG